MKTTLTRDSNRHGSECRYCELNTWKSVWKKGEATLKVTKKTLKT